MAIVVKKIKAPRLREDAMRLALLNPMKEVGNEIKREYLKITKSWTRVKPTFEILRAISSRWGTVEVAVLTNSDVFGWLDDGTPAHDITPKSTNKSGRLRFKWAGPGSYKAKTKVRWIGSRGGGQTGTWIRPKKTRHKGIPAREFSKEIKRYMEPRFKRRMEKAMRDVAAVSGIKSR